MKRSHAAALALVGWYPDRATRNSFPAKRWPFPGQKREPGEVTPGMRESPRTALVVDPEAPLHEWSQPAPSTAPPGAKLNASTLSNASRRPILLSVSSPATDGSRKKLQWLPTEPAASKIGWQRPTNENLAHFGASDADASSPIPRNRCIPKTSHIKTPVPRLAKCF
jgi:hypothetical protein